jgi:hypothetical protein
MLTDLIGWFGRRARPLRQYAGVIVCVALGVVLGSLALWGATRLPFGSRLGR